MRGVGIIVEANVESVSSIFEYNVEGVGNIFLCLSIKGWYHPRC